VQVKRLRLVLKSGGGTYRNAAPARCQILDSNMVTVDWPCNPVAEPHRWKVSSLPSIDGKFTQESIAQSSSSFVCCVCCRANSSWALASSYCGYASLQPPLSHDPSTLLRGSLSGEHTPPKATRQTGQPKGAHGALAPSFRSLCSYLSQKSDLVAFTAA
jgi:hypothetical protein